MTHHQSLWNNNVGLSTPLNAINKDLETDILIIGSGLVGILTAYYLQGKTKITILEGMNVAEGVTSNSTAKITAAHGIFYQQLIKNFGEQQAKIYAAANLKAIADYQLIIKENDIDCDFQVDDAYTCSHEEKQKKIIKDEFEASATLSMPVEYLETAALPFPIFGCIKFSNQAYFHPKKFLISLTEKILPNVEIYVNSRAGLVKKNKDWYYVGANGHTIKAKHVVVATNYPTINQGKFYAKLRADRSYVLAIHPRNAVSGGMFYSTDNNSYYSVRKQKIADDEFILIGGENHSVGAKINTALNYQKLTDFAEKNFGIASLDYSWSTQDNWTFDAVPFAGQVSGHRNLFVACGFGGWGFTNGMVSAQIITDLIMGKENMAAELYNPGRSISKSVLIKENIKAVKQYFFPEKKDTIESEDQLNNEEGKYIKSGSSLVAISNVEQEVITLAAHCTHKGCMLNWNAGELSWDCPCHGSRFDNKGEVIQSPAVKNLKQIKIKDK